MLKIRPFQLKIHHFVLRFYLMMAIVLIGGFMGQLIAGTVIGFAVGISFIMGLSASPGGVQNTLKTNKYFRLEAEERLKKTA